MSYKVYFIGAGAFLIIAAVIYFIYQILQLQRNQVINKSDKINKTGRNKLHVFYKIFRTTPGLKKIFSQILLNTESVYPADPMSVNREATKIMLKGISFSAVIILITLVTSFIWGVSLLLICGGVLTSVVCFFYNINNTFREMEYTLLGQFKIFLENVRHHYMNCGIVEDSVEETLDEIPYEIGLHIARIHEILVSPIMEEKVEEYAAEAPNRFFLLLLSICSSIKEYGGETFTDSLSYLKEEINIEILKMDAIRNAFSGIQLVSLLVVLFLRPIQIWAESCMPDLEDFYRGTYGTCILVAAFLMSFGAYYLVDILRDGKRGELIKDSLYAKISRIPKLSRILNQVVNKSYTKYRYLNEQMKEIGDQTGPKAFIVKQVIFALAAFFIVTSATITSTVREKFTMLENYVAEFDSDITPNERYLATMQETASNYVQDLKKANLNTLTEEDIANDILESGALRNEDYAAAVAKSVYAELKSYKNTYYHWYSLLIALAAAAIGFYIPKGVLEFKCMITSMNKEDEIAQFQTIVLVLMHVDGIRLDQILEWMDRFAYSFKESIDECIVSLESGEQAALEHMKNSEDNDSFKRFVDCLLTIDETDVPTAFGEIRIDRDYSLRKREQDNAISINKKSSIANIIGLAPATFVMLGYLLMPMMIMAVKMYMAMDFAI